jgi:hypothetical protein
VSKCTDEKCSNPGGEYHSGRWDVNLFWRAGEDKEWLGVPSIGG